MLRVLIPYRRRNQKGAAMVETALVFVTTLSMILFIVDMGRVLLIEQLLAERAVIRRPLKLRRCVLI